MLSPNERSYTMGEVLPSDSGQAQPWYADVAKTVATTYATVQQADALRKINIERAKRGEPPLESLSAGVNIGLSPEMKMIAFAALALLAIYVLSGKKR